MMMHTITFSVDNNMWLKRLDTQPNESANQNSIIAPKVISQRMRKRYYI